MKIERTQRLTDLDCPKSPAQSLHTPSTSHTNPQTSPSRRQNNHFRLIYSNIRNYSFFLRAVLTNQLVLHHPTSSLRNNGSEWFRTVSLPPEDMRGRLGLARFLQFLTKANFDWRRWRRVVNDNLHSVDYSDLGELRRDGNSLETTVKFYS